MASVALASMGLLGCEGLRSDDEIIDYGPGMIAEPAWPFQCSDEPPENIGELVTWENNIGELCGEDSAWAELIVNRNSAYSITLVRGAEIATVAVLDPEGEQKAQIDQDTPTVAVEMATGQWIFEVTALDPLAPPPEEQFELSVVPVRE